MQPPPLPVASPEVPLTRDQEAETRSRADRVPLLKINPLPAHSPDHSPSSHPGGAEVPGLSTAERWARSREGGGGGAGNGRMWGPIWEPRGWGKVWGKQDMLLPSPYPLSAPSRLLAGSLPAPCPHSACAFPVPCLHPVLSPPSGAVPRLVCAQMYFLFFNEFFFPTQDQLEIPNHHTTRNTPGGAGRVISCSRRSGTGQGTNHFVYQAGKGKGRSWQRGASRHGSCPSQVPLKFFKASKQQLHRLPGELFSAYRSLSAPFIPVSKSSSVQPVPLDVSRFSNNQAGGKERGNFCQSIFHTMGPR